MEMEIIEYFSSDNKEYWLSKIKESDWGAGQFLYDLLKNEKLKQLVGEHTRVLMLTDGDTLVSYCTLADKDDIQPTELTPWIGWVYTFPAYRGNRHVGKLLDHAAALAKDAGIKSIYISTNHNGLYEKYGYEFFAMMEDMHGEDSRVYVRYL
jgi:predicted GNAT family N-acyltransferase